MCPLSLVSDMVSVNGSACNVLNCVVIPDSGQRKADTYIYRPNHLPLPLSQTTLNHQLCLLFCAFSLKTELEKCILDRWLLDNRLISPEGLSFNTKNEIVLFELSEMTNSTEKVTWKMKSVLTKESVGAALNCRAQYHTGSQKEKQLIIETPKSLLHEIKVTSDTDLVILTPETGTVVTLTVLAPFPPSSSNFLIPTVCKNICKLKK